MPYNKHDIRKNLMIGCQGWTNKIAMIRDLGMTKSGAFKFVSLKEIGILEFSLIHTYLG